MSDKSSFADIGALLQFIGQVDRNTLISEASAIWSGMLAAQEEILSYYHAKQWRELTRKAHSFKSNCVYFGAHPLKKVTVELEHIDNLSVDQQERLFQEWQKVFTATRKEITMQLNGEQ